MKRIPMAVFRWWIALFNPLTVFCWFVGAIIAGGGATMYFTTRPASTLLSIAEDADAVVSSDGKLTLIVSTDKHRFCPADVQRWLDKPVMVAGMTIPIYRYLGNIPAPPVPLGVQRYGIELDIPATWDKPGTNYESRSDFRCGLVRLFEPASTQTGPVPINKGAS